MSTVLRCIRNVAVLPPGVHGAKAALRLNELHPREPLVRDLRGRILIAPHAENVAVYELLALNAGDVLRRAGAFHGLLQLSDKSLRNEIRSFFAPEYSWLLLFYFCFIACRAYDCTPNFESLALGDHISSALDS